MPKALKDLREISIKYEIPIERTATFWEKLKEGRIHTTKCKGCGELYFPPQADCPKCLKSEMDWVELSGDAEIESFTHVVIRPLSFQQYEPYTVAVGKCKEGPKVVAWVKGVKLKDIKVGMPVKLVGTVGPEGNPTYEFVPR